MNHPASAREPSKMHAGPVESACASGNAGSDPARRPRGGEAAGPRADGCRYRRLQRRPSMVSTPGFVFNGACISQCWRPGATATTAKIHILKLLAEGLV
jgi:hypothetical protein